jgi:hypothetical protein
LRRPQLAGFQVSTEADAGVTGRDQTVLFVWYGDPSLYAHVSSRVKAAIKGDPESLAPTTLARRLTLAGGFVIEVDGGWNGVNYYGFAPLE